ncbi:MAG: sugar phosphate isomerase/epimerase [Chloroflexi bacterium]|nr:sugar phosphate isomerase/epimerase [Chloroflexota bacterium]
MRLGVSHQIIPKDYRAIDDRFAAKIAQLGFTGVGIHFAGDTDALPKAGLQRVRQIFADHGIRVVQSWGRQEWLCHTDEAIRRESVRTLQQGVREAADLGAMMVGTRPGSMNPRGTWWPHRDNYTQAVEDALVRSLRETAPICEEVGIPLAFESHVTTVLNSAAAIRRVIERTESPWVKVSLDPVNFVGDFPTLYNMAPMINELFDVLGPYIVAAHLKDVYAEDRHVIHISETVPGDGIFDFDTFFRRFEALLPDGYGIIEHLPESLVPQARAYVGQKLKELNIPIK